MDDEKLRIYEKLRLKIGHKFTEVKDDNKTKSSKSSFKLETSA